MVKKHFIPLFLILLNILVIPNVYSKRLEKIEFDNYYLSEDNRVKITISPKYYSGGEIIINVTNKKPTVRVNCMIGFDKDVFQYKDILLYVNRTDVYYNYRQINQSYYDDNRYNITFESKDDVYFYNGSLTLWDTVFNNETQKLEWYNHAYNYVWIRKTDFMMKTQHKEYVEWESIRNNFNKLDLYYDTLEHWFISKSFQLKQNKQYSIKVIGKMKIQFNKTNDYHKGVFGVAFKPYSLTLGEAITQKKLYYIEPSWYNLDWGYRKEIVWLNNSRATTNEMPLIRIYEGSGTDDLNGDGSVIDAILYIDDAKIQEDFDDIRWTKNDGETLLDQYRWDLDSGNYSDYSIRLEGNLTSDITTYLYYGNSGASLSSSGDALSFYNIGSLSGFTKTEGDDTWSASSGYIDSIHADNTWDRGYFSIDYQLHEGYHIKFDLQATTSYGTWRTTKLYIDEDTNPYETINADCMSYTPYFTNNNGASEYTRLAVYDSGVYQFELDSGDKEWLDRNEWLYINSYFDENNDLIYNVTDGTDSISLSNTSLNYNLKFNYLWLSARRHRTYWDNIELRKWLDDYEIKTVGSEETTPINRQGTPQEFFGSGFNDTITPYTTLRWELNETFYNTTIYEIERNGTTIGTTSNKYYNDTSVSNGDFYRYRVRSCFNFSGSWYNGSWTDYYNYEKVYFESTSASVLIPTTINTINANEYILLVFNIILIGVSIIGLQYPVVSIVGCFIWTFNILPDFTLSDLGYLSIITFVCLVFMTILGISKRW